MMNNNNEKKNVFKYFLFKLIVLFHFQIVFSDFT